MQIKRWHLSSSTQYSTELDESKSSLLLIDIVSTTLLRNFLYALVENRWKSVLAHAAQFCRAGTRIKYASSFLRFRISLGLNSEPSKPHEDIVGKKVSKLRSLAELRAFYSMYPCLSWTVNERSLSPTGNPAVSLVKLFLAGNSISSVRRFFLDQERKILKFHEQFNRDSIELPAGDRNLSVPEPKRRHGYTPECWSGCQMGFLSSNGCLSSNAIWLDSISELSSSCQSSQNYAWPL